MGDEQKQPWYKSLPTILTAAAGFIAALSGLVAGLNQLGAFRHEQPAPQVVGTAPAATPADNTAQDTVSRATPAAGPARPAPTRAPAAPDTTVAAPARVPKGMVLELTVPTRICGPAEGWKRFTARLMGPVRVGTDTVLPAGMTAVLRLRRAGSPAAPQVRLDSLVGKNLALAMPQSQVRIRHGASSGACLKANARLAATLAAAVVLPSP